MDYENVQNDCFITALNHSCENIKPYFYKWLHDTKQTELIGEQITTTVANNFMNYMRFTIPVILVGAHPFNDYKYSPVAVCRMGDPNGIYLSGFMVLTTRYEYGLNNMGINPGPGHYYFVCDIKTYFDEKGEKITKTLNRYTHLCGLENTYGKPPTLDHIKDPHPFPELSDAERAEQERLLAEAKKNKANKNRADKTQHRTFTRKDILAALAGAGCSRKTYTIIHKTSGNAKSRLMGCEDFAHTDDGYFIWANERTHQLIVENIPRDGSVSPIFMTDVLEHHFGGRFGIHDYQTDTGSKILRSGGTATLRNGKTLINVDGYPVLIDGDM